MGLCCYGENSDQNLILITALIKENEAKVNEIVLLNKLNQEMEEKNQLLKEKVTNLECNTWRGENYAQIVEKGTNARSNAKITCFASKINNIPSVVIKPRNGQNSTKTKSDLENRINPAQLNIGISNIRITKTGTAIVKCSSVESVDILRKYTEQNLKNNYEVGITKLKKPRIKIIEYEGDLSREEIEESIRNQNNFFNTDDYLKITYIKKNNKGKTIYGECSPKVYQHLLDNKKVYIGWQRYRIFEDLGIPKCYKCQAFYHKSNDCKNKKVCAYCAEEHQESECPRQTKKCINCILANNKYKTKYKVDHETTDHECPAYKYQIQMLKNKIDYNING